MHLRPFLIFELWFFSTLTPSVCTHNVLRFFNDARWRQEVSLPLPVVILRDRRPLLSRLWLAVAFPSRPWFSDWRQWPTSSAWTWRKTAALQFSFRAAFRTAGQLLLTEADSGSAPASVGFINVEHTERLLWFSVDKNIGWWEERLEPWSTSAD